MFIYILYIIGAGTKVLGTLYRIDVQRKLRLACAKYTGLPEYLLLIYARYASGIKLKVNLVLLNTSGWTAFTCKGEFCAYVINTSTKLSCLCFSHTQGMQVRATDKYLVMLDTSV